MNGRYLRRRPPELSLFAWLLSWVCVLLCFIEPILWNRYGPGVSSGWGQGAPTHEMDRQSATSPCSPLVNLGRPDPHPSR